MSLRHDRPLVVLDHYPDPQVKKGWRWRVERNDGRVLKRASTRVAALKWACKQKFRIWEIGKGQVSCPGDFSIDE